MNVSGLIASINASGNAYSQWIRQALARCGDQDRHIDVLFGSSVDEPTELLRGLIETSFREPITDRYQSPFRAGNPVVVSRLCERYDITPAQVLCTTGATGALALIFKTYLNASDRVLVENPGFDLFADLALGQGAEVARFERTAPDYGLNPETIEALVDERTRAVIVSNLHNPSGVLVADTVLADLAQRLARHDVLLIVDEVYGDYADTAERAGPAHRLGRNVLSINSMTKVYGLSTVRCGWVIGDEALIEPIRTVSDRFEFSISKLGHSVAALVLDHQAEFDAHSRAGVEEARVVMSEFADLWQAQGLARVSVPRFGCICFVELQGIADTTAFSDWLTDEKGVIVAPGECFGTPGFIRIGFALPQAQLRGALTRLTEGLRDYRQV